MAIENIILIFFLFFIIVAASVLAIYFVIYFSHEKEGQTSHQLTFQIAIVIGLVLPFIIMILPIFEYIYEAINTKQRGEFEVENLDFFSKIYPLLYFLAVVLILFNQFAISFYRNIDSDSKNRLSQSIVKPTIIFVLCFGLGFFIYYVFSIASPFCTAINNENFTNSGSAYDISSTQRDQRFFENYKITLFDSFQCLIIIAGTICFMTFTAAGILTYPIDLIMQFMNLPGKPDAEKLVFAKQALQKKSEQLLDQGRSMHSKINDVDLMDDDDPKKMEKQNLMLEEFQKMRSEYFFTRDFYERYQQETNILDLNLMLSIFLFFTGIVFLAIGCLIVVDNYVQYSNKNLFLHVFVYFQNKSFGHAIAFYLVVILDVYICTFKSIFTTKRLFSSSTDYEDIQLGKTWMDTFLNYTTILLLSSIGFLTYIIITNNAELGQTYSYIIIRLFITRINYVKILYFNNVSFITFFLVSLVSVIFLFFKESGKDVMEMEIQKIKHSLNQQQKKLEEEEV